jgi:hypothetical protein
VYQLASPESSSDRTEAVAAYRGGRILFDRPVTFRELDRYIADGFVIKKTQISDDFSYEDFVARYGESALLLFMVEDGRKLTVVTSQTEAAPRAGQKLIALVREVDDQPKQKNGTHGAST